MRRALCVLLFCVTTVAWGSDAYLIRFRSDGPVRGCEELLWRDNVLFYNQGTEPVSVRLLGMSNAAPPPDALASIALPPGKVVSLNDTTRSWDAGASLWVLHVDVPPGVIVESRDEALRTTTCSATTFPPASLAKVSMPIVRALVPAGATQVYLGTDLGVIASRMNIGVYNDALVPASATITVRRTCDDAIMDSRTVGVPAHSIVQFNGFQSGEHTLACFFSGWSRYVTITVDQPSFAYVANLTESFDTTGFAPTVGLAVTQNTTF
jgi:hypothetical protein